MDREMQIMIKNSKQTAAELVSYANPKSRKRPSIERVKEILSGRVPYRGEKPVITNVSITEYGKNILLKWAYFKVETADGKVWKITAYQHLKGRTQEEKETDKTATFPSGLFNIFHAEIV